MKVIFLDIDGVMNSKIFDREKGDIFMIMDPTRLELLRELVEKTNAEIVLSSSWRSGWEKEECDCTSDVGIKLWNEFAEADIYVYDKTPEGYYSRAREIKAWLNENEVESFVILDDIAYGWEELDDNVVRTCYSIGRGLEKRHVDEAIMILNGEA